LQSSSPENGILRLILWSHDLQSYVSFSKTKQIQAAVLVCLPHLRNSSFASGTFVPQDMTLRNVHWVAVKKRAQKSQLEKK
jgi:hypothetical protein